MILKKSGKVRKCLAWILSVLVVFLSVPFTASSANGAEIKKRVITGIAGYQNDDTPIVTIPAAAGTAYNDLGLPDKLIVKYGTASASDASSSDATKADAEQTLGTGIVIDMVTASDLTAAEDDSYAVTALKKEASSMSAALKSGEYLAKIPVTWNIVSGVYGDSAGKWDFKAEWNRDDYPLEDSFDPDIFIRVEETGLLKQNLLLSASVEAEYTVNYDTNGGTPLSIEAKTGVLWNDTGLLPTEVPTRPGYYLLGWETQETNIEVTSTTDYATCAEDDTALTSVTLKAVWKEASNITIFYQTADPAKGSVSRRFETGSPLTGPFLGSTATAVAGYKFDHWTDSSDTATGSDATFVPEKNADGIYETETYTANFASDTTATAAYQIQYYQQNVSGSGYTFVPADTVNTTDVIGNEPVVSEKSYSGFTLSHTTYEATAKAQSGTAIPIAADGSLVVKAYYDRKVNSVTYDVQGHGLAPAEQNRIRYGATLTEPAALSEVGYIFGGWYKEPACENAWNFSNNDTMPDSSLTLYAKWTANSYTVSFATEEHGTLGGTTTLQTVAYGKNATNACTATANADYYFTGWSYSYVTADNSQVSGVVPDYTSIPVCGDLTFTAQYAHGTNYAVIKGKNGYVAIGTDLNSLDPASDTNGHKVSDSYSFSNENPQMYYVKFTPVSQDYVLQSIIAANVGDSNSASIPISTTDASKTTDATLSNNSVSITFTYSINDGYIVVTGANSSTLPFTLTVTYEKIQTKYYVYHFIQNKDGTWPKKSTDMDSYSDVGVGSVLNYSLNNYTGYTFNAAKATYEDSNTQARPLHSLEYVSSNGSSVVNLYYDVNTHNVIFDINGHGTAVDAKTVNYGAKIANPGDLSANGYTFGGWYTDNTCSEANKWDLAADTMPDYDVTLYAKWTENNDVTINYIPSDSTMGSVMRTSETISPVSGTAAGSTAAPKTGYHFVSWTDDNDHGVVVSTDATFTPAKTTDNVYAAGSYTANFIVNTDTPYQIKHYQQNVAGNGYKLTDTENLTGATNNPASYTEKTYTGYTYEASQTTYRDSSHSAPVLTELPVAADGSLVIGLYYNLDTNNVTFDANGHGTSPESLTRIRYGAAVEEPADPSEAGFIFGGWYKDLTCTDAWDFTSDTMPDENISLFAKWTENSNVTITYNSADTVMGTVNLASESVPPATGTAKGSTATANTGYHFVSWTDAAGAVVSTSPVFIPEKVGGINITAAYTANFAINQYTATFDVNGHGTAPADQKLTYDEIITEPAAPTETGYIFGGWFEEAVCTNAWNFASDKVSGNTTLYAKWSKQSTVSTASNANGSGSSGSDSAPNSSTGENASGTWSKETVPDGTRWQFKKTDGTVAKDTWIKTGDKWYHFDSNGYAQTGWVQDQGKWYHCDSNSCAMDTGLYHDNTDSHDYYMNTDGSMATGWVTINGKQYYFNPNSAASTYAYDPVTQTWIWNGGNALPYGAMLKNTITPDGHHVDETGVRID